MNIINKPSITIAECEVWLNNKEGVSLLANKLLPIIWVAATRNDIDPCVLLAQALIETNNFNDIEHLNGCNTGSLRTAIYSHGMVMGFEKGYTKFNSWNEGIHAHADHLALYAGVKGFPKHNPHVKTNEYNTNELTLDPMHFHYLFGTCTKVENLSGDWSKTNNYGQEIVNLVNDMINYTRLLRMN